MCIVDIGPGREVDNVVDELLGGEAGDKTAGEEGLARAAGTDHGEGELVPDGQLHDDDDDRHGDHGDEEFVPDGQLQEELLLESLGSGHDQALAGHGHRHLHNMSWK